jgi:hypothetical protein
MLIIPVTMLIQLFKKGGGINNIIAVMFKNYFNTN